MAYKKKPKLIKGYIYRLTAHDVLAVYKGKKLSNPPNITGSKYYRYHFEDLNPKKDYPKNYYFRFLTQDTAILDRTATTLYGNTEV